MLTCPCILINETQVDQLKYTQCAAVESQDLEQGFWGYSTRDSKVLQAWPDTAIVHQQEEELRRVKTATVEF